MFRILCFINLVIQLSSCSKGDLVCCGPPGPELFIFGKYYGECDGPGCVIIYKMENEKLYEDTLDVVPYLGFLAGRFVVLPDSDYLIAKELIQKVPTFLFSENKHIYGCPDGGDWGGMYLEIKYGSDHRSWLIDLMNENLSEDLISFKDEVVKVMGAIR